MNVLIVHCGKGIYGGAELVIVKLANYLYEQGHSIKIIAKDMDIDFGELGSGIICYHPPTYNELRNTVQEYIGWSNVVNVHNFPATLTTFPSRLQTRAVVWMCNEPAEMFTNWKRKPIEAFNRWWVKSSGMGAIVADKYNADRFERIYKVKPRIIPYGVDYDYWSEGLISRSSTSLQLLQVGTISPYKGQLDSVFVLMGLLANNVDATLTLVGEVSDKEYFKKVMSYHNHKINGRIKYIGHLPRNRIREYYYSHNVLLHPVKEQGGWLVPFEAICAGLPVITAKEFPASDIISEHKLGVVTGNMLKAVRDGCYKEIDTEYAKKWVRENLTWAKFGEEMVNAYKANLGK